jgi:hypothetical protein
MIKTKKTKKRKIDQKIFKGDNLGFRGKKRRELSEDLNRRGIFKDVKNKYLYIYISL